MSAKAPRICVAVLTHNEEVNLPLLMESVEGLADEILIVDSGSSDRTVEIAKKSGARVLAHRFETHSRQWNWALAKISPDVDWVLALDADQRVTPALRDEITRALQSTPVDVDGFYVRRRQIFRGRWIRNGGYYRKYLLKLFRRGRGSSDEGELVDHRFYVKGKTEKLENDIIEDNRKEDSITAWTEKHLNYVARQAREECLRRRGELGWAVPPRLFGTPDQRVLWLKRLWYRLPLFLRPMLYFGYRYFFRLGFLDGKEGFIFHFLHSFWYRLLVDIRLDELERNAEPTSQSSAESREALTGSR